MVGAGRHVLLIAVVIAYRFATPKRPAVQMRLVVLPFPEPDGDPSQEFFADGMTEEILSAWRNGSEASRSLPARRR